MGQVNFDCYESIKKNIITKANNHNGSMGSYFNYGNRGNFGMIDGSSVGQYTYKCFQNDL